MFWPVFTNVLTSFSAPLLLIISHFSTSASKTVSSAVSPYFLVIVWVSPTCVSFCDLVKVIVTLDEISELIAVRSFAAYESTSSFVVGTTFFMLSYTSERF